ncbi:MAG TPA: zinc-dependent alcohol dehydrogenase family protein [Acidobacteriota bacterium]|nr:zinc-dependent alcohol dehydrogenase family protein [Acidobacteriota bacterium]
MTAMVLEEQGRALEERRLDIPRPEVGEVLLRVRACAVCRTDLHVLDGDLKEPKLPLILGHEIVGEVEETGEDVDHLSSGDRVGVPWLGWSCGECRFCRDDQENLCDQARFTGYQIDGGFADYTTADARFCIPIPEEFDDQHAAPLLCAGLIGYRSLRKCGDPGHLGLYGFGAAAHIICQVAVHQGRKVYAFTRPGDEKAQKFARRLGAEWAGGSDTRPPEDLDAAIIFAPVGPLVPEALKAVRKGGCVICGGIHMSDIPSFPYEILWGERMLASVANLTRQDGIQFMQVAPKAGVSTEVTIYPLSQANQALEDLRNGNLEGAAVLVP